MEYILILGESERIRCDMALEYLSQRKSGVYTLLFAAGIEPSAPELPRLSKRMMDYIGEKLISSGHVYTDGAYEGPLTRIYLLEIGPSFRWGTFEEMVSLITFFKTITANSVTIISERFHLPRIKLIWKLLPHKGLRVMFWLGKSEAEPNSKSSEKLKQHEFKKSIGMYVFALVYYFFGETGFDWLSKKKNVALNT